MRRLLLCSVLFGCASVNWASRVLHPVCSAACFDALFVNTDGEGLDCVGVAVNVQIARDALAPVIPEDLYCESVRQVRSVLITRDTFFDATLDGRKIGSYQWPAETMKLNGNMTALVHELIHHWDFSTRDGGAMDAPAAWDALGYSDADQRYFTDPRRVWPVAY